MASKPLWPKCTINSVKYLTWTRYGRHVFCPSSRPQGLSWQNVLEIITTTIHELSLNTLPFNVKCPSYNQDIGVLHYSLNLNNSINLILVSKMKITKLNPLQPCKSMRKISSRAHFPSLHHNNHVFWSSWLLAVVLFIESREIFFLFHL